MQLIEVFDIDETWVFRLLNAKTEKLRHMTETIHTMNLLNYIIINKI